MAKKATASKAAAIAVIPTAGAVTSTLTVDMTSGRLPDLTKAIPKPLNLDFDYWTPEAEGESKILVFLEVRENDVIPDFNDPEKTVLKDCAYFVEQQGESYQIIRSSARRLVSASKNFIQGEVYQITFMGQRKNRTNNNMSNCYAIQAMELAA